MISFNLNDEIKAQLKDVNNRCAELYATIRNIDQKELEAIERYAKVSTLGASTRIENALLTNSEIDWIETILTSDGKTTALSNNKSLIKNKFSKDRSRSIEEVAGCRQMLMFIYQNADYMKPLRESDVRELHKLLMEPYLKKSPYVGNYKVQSNSVIETNKETGETRDVFKTADAGVITKAAMSDLLIWYNKALSEELSALPVICEFVYRFLAIHPFQDGNGRLGRGLFLLGMLQSNEITLSEIVRYISIDRQIEKNKEEYYFVLNLCSKGSYSDNTGDYKIFYLLRFMLKVISLSISDVDIYRKKYEITNKLSESATAVLTCFKENPETTLTIKDIIDLIKLPRRTISYNLKILSDYGLIQKYGQLSGARYQITF